MNAKSNVPEVRFKEFSCEWEEREFLTFVTRVSVVSDNTLFPRVEYEDIISGKGRLNKDVYQKKNSKTGIKFDKGDVLFGKLRPYLKNWLLPDFDGVAVGDFWVLRANDSNNKFLYYLIQTDKFEMVANQSSGSKMPRSDWGLVSKALFCSPRDVTEQARIGNYLQQIDTLIAQHQKKHDKLLNIKKALLEKMFPKQSEDMPGIRFKGFSNKWRERKLLDNFDKIIDFRGRTPKKLGLDWSESGYLALSALNVKNGYIDLNIDAHYGSQNLYDKWMLGNELHKNQVLFTTEAPMGNVTQVPDNKKYILSQRTIAFEVKPKLIAESFLAVMLVTPLMLQKLTSLSSGGTAKGVSQKSLAAVDAYTPKEIAEQEKIGKLFKQLDTLISHHQTQLNKLNHIKQACLAKMFV